MSTTTTHNSIIYTLSSDQKYYTVTGYDGEPDDVQLEANIQVEIEGKATEIPVTEISRDAFAECESLISIALPDSITTIGDFAFYNCSKLEQIVLGNSKSNLKIIGEKAFSGAASSLQIYYAGSKGDWDQITGRIVACKTTKQKIDHFDLVFYPFKTVYGLNNKTEYKNSFNYTSENLEEIRSDLALCKNIAHNIITPSRDDIVSIKNYLKLKARVTTTKKVTLIEESEILNNIYKAIYANFNARQIELGEEIPYETIVSVLKNADYRIKEISLDEPSLSTTFRLGDSFEEKLSTNDASSDRAKKLYNSLVRRNILAGRISAFQYDTAFIPEYDKIPYDTYESVYPNDSSITKVESHFDVGEAFRDRDTKEEPDGYVLKENEVIQFRVPNFKTTKTYPAYVNYFIKLNTENPGEGAVPATFETLGNFLQDKWNAIVNLPDIAKNVSSTEADGTELQFDTKDAFIKSEAKHGALFTKSDGSYTQAAAEDYAASTLYYFIPFKPLSGQQSIFWTLNNWIKNIAYPNVSYDIYTQLNGIYRTVGVQEKPYGRLIDEAQYKYLPAYNFGNLSDDRAALDTFYIQVTSEETDPKDPNKKIYLDGLGQDASYTGVPKDGEYCLKTGEYLLINYTDSKTDESGTEQKTVVNKVYTEGDIIRANFILIDSALYHNNHSYSKRDGFTFAGQQPEGMFTLGTNEQIEIRDIVQVELNEGSTYLYWTLNSDDPNKNSNEFIFNEDYNINPSTRKDANGVTWGTVEEPIHNAYTLKEGEHLYYTNSKKQDLVYYGYGTLIVKNNPGLKLVKNSRNGEVSEEEIMTNGLAAAIPWESYDLSKTKQLTIIENQYISLTEGDMIVAIEDTNPGGAETMCGGNWNNWTSLQKGTAEYRLAEDESNSHLPAVVVNDINWAIRSRLDFNMSKELAQPLHRGDRLTISFKSTSKPPVILESKYNPEAKTYETVYVNSNYTCQAAVDTIDFSSLSDSDEGFKLKISKQAAPTVLNTKELLRLNNYINGDAKYTKFNFANLPTLAAVEETPADSEETPAFSLKINIPRTSTKDGFMPYGLIAVYYIRDESAIKSSTPAKITATLTTGSANGGIRLFNKNKTYERSKELDEGLNIIQVHPNVETLEFYADGAAKDTVIFGSLDIVTGINPKLDYRIFKDDDLKLTQLLDDLRESGVADDFYYNVPIQRATEIDLNPNIEDDLLSSPLAWYDPNNVNRKFVISEIDADYLSTGITLTKGSRA